MTYLISRVYVISDLFITRFHCNKLWFFFFYKLTLNHSFRWKLMKMDNTHCEIIFVLSKIFRWKIMKNRQYTLWDGGQIIEISGQPRSNCIWNVPMPGIELRAWTWAEALSVLFQFQGPFSQRLAINRTIDINHSSMANRELRKLAINRKNLCETGPSLTSLIL